MRKFIACLLLLVFMAPFAAQANEIIVGNGTTSSYNAPFNNFYKNSWNETIYPASGFMLPGTINTISYNCATAVLQAEVHILQRQTGNRKVN